MVQSWGQWVADFKSQLCALIPSESHGLSIPALECMAVVADPEVNNSSALVHFLPCPDMYCCEGKASPTNPWPCDSVSACARNRTGTLCSHCQPGMTEVFGSPACVPLRRCTYVEVGIVCARAACSSLAWVAVHPLGVARKGQGGGEEGNTSFLALPCASCGANSAK